MNGWKVIWTQEGKRLMRRFQGDSPKESGAVAFARKLRGRGFVVDGVVSQKKAFPPPKGKTLGKGVWCPYCVKWRDFRVYAIRKYSIVVPPILRCPVCQISINDGFVRAYNQHVFLEYSIISEDKARKAARRKNRGKA